MSVAKRDAVEKVTQFGRLSVELLSHIEELSQRHDKTNEEIAMEVDEKMKTLSGVQEDLEDAVSRLKTEQDFFSSIAQLHAKIGEKDHEIHSLIRSLQRTERNLQDLLNTSQSTVDAIKMSEQHPVAVDDLVVYSHRICGVMGAPPAVLEISGGYYKPPFPETAAIQTSRLYVLLIETAMMRGPDQFITNEFGQRVENDEFLRFGDDELLPDGGDEGLFATTEGTSGGGGLFDDFQ